MNNKFTIICLLLLQLQALQSQVGINTVTPNALLDIKSDEMGMLIPRVSLSGRDDITTVYNPSSGALVESTLIYNTSTAGIGANAIAPGFYFWSGTSWYSPFDSQWLKAGTLFKSTGINDNIYTLGRVGINVNDPLYDLDVSGDMRLTRNRNLFISNGILSSNNGTNIYYSNRLEWLNRGENTYWRTSGMDTGNGSENAALTIKNSSGFVSIGEGAPSQLLHVVQGNAMIDASRRFMFDRLGDNTDIIQFIRENDIANGSSELQLWIGDNDGGADTDAFVLGHLDLNTNPRVFKGTMEFRSNSVASKRVAGPWSTLSDLRVKKNVEPFTDGLDKILEIEPVSFEYNGKAGTENSDRRYVGVIAQQVAPIAPYLVTEHKENQVKNLLSYDATAVDYMLVNAINTLSRKRDTIHTRLEIVNSRLSSIQKRIDELKSKGMTAKKNSDTARK